MMNRGIFCCVMIGLLAVVLITGCGTTPPAVFYTLSPMTDAGSATSVALSEPVAIGIGPIQFPDELNRPMIVTRSGQNRLEVNEFRRWGGSLGKNVTRVMVENLSLLMQTDQVMARPWERYFKPDVRIALDIRQFDGHLEEYALLNVTWVLIAPEDDSVLAARRTIIKENVSSGSGYDALVEAQSLALARLCKEIANVLSEVQKVR